MTDDDFIPVAQFALILSGMEHHAPRKYRGPETWALVRDAYLAGEPAKLVCQRFDVSYANLRAKASREGWTRKAHAGATDLRGVRRAASPSPGASGSAAPDAAAQPFSPSDPRAALDAGIARASEALAAGRAQDAAAMLKATETFARLHGQDIASVVKPAAHDPRAEEQVLIKFLEEVWDAAESLAKAMMSDDRAHIHPAWASRNVYAWRAQHFGAEVAAADYAYARERGVAKAIWDENGVLHPPTPRGEIPFHMRGAFAHYGPNRTRKYPEGAEDEL